MKNMKVTLLFFYLMVFTHFTQAQITVTGSDGVAGESNTTLTLSYTVPAGVDRLLLVSVGTDLIPTSVTYAGNLMTVQGGGTNVWTTTLGSGVAETGDIVFTVGSSAFFMGINAISFSGVDQTTPVDNYYEGVIGIGETSTDVTITSRADDLVYDGVIVGCFSTNCGSPPIATPNVGQTLQNDLSFIGSLFTGRGATSTKAGALLVHVGSVSYTHLTLPTIYSV